MKAVAVVILSMYIASLAHAVGDNCYQIQNHDAKNFCLDTAKNESSYYYQIWKQDEKIMCLTSPLLLLMNH